jgi:hypothetical protein
MWDDNGDIDPNSFAKIFSPFPERTTSTLLTDARKLREAGFEENGGPLGLYYEPVGESYDRMILAAIAEKFSLDVSSYCRTKIRRIFAASIGRLIPRCSAHSRVVPPRSLFEASLRFGLAFVTGLSPGFSWPSVPISCQISCYRAFVHQ